MGIDALAASGSGSTKFAIKGGRKERDDRRKDLWIAERIEPKDFHTCIAGRHHEKPIVAVNDKTGWRPQFTRTITKASDGRDRDALGINYFDGALKSIGNKNPALGIPGEPLSPAVGSKAHEGAPAESA